MEGVARQLKGGKSAAVEADKRAWREWRSKNNNMPLEEALKDPEAWRLFSAVLQHSRRRPNFVNYEDWLACSQARLKWAEWKRSCGKPAREALADPEGWALYVAMKQEKGDIVPDTYSEWLQQQDSDKAWAKWRRAHPGLLTQVLGDPEGWQLYKAKHSHRGHQAPLPDTYEEWLKDPQVLKLNATALWTAWRRTHTGPLRKVLADPEGYELYRHMQEAAGMQAQPTYDEWKENKKSRGMPSWRSWILWRRANPGRLSQVLSDPEGWQLYREMLEARQQRQREKYGVINKEVPSTYEEWLADQPNRAVKTADSGEEQTETKKLHAKKNNGISNVSKKKRKAAMEAWLSWLSLQPSADLSVLLQNPIGWQLYRAAMSKPGRPLPETYEAYSALEAASAAWTAWRKEHPGSSVVVLQNPEGWRLYTTLMQARNIQVPATYAEWMQLPEQRTAVAAQNWLQWSEKHKEEPIMNLLATNKEGWQLFSAFLQSIDAPAPETFKEWETNAVDFLCQAQENWQSNADVRYARRITIYVLKQTLAKIRNEPFPDTYEAWLRSSSRRLGNMRASAWNEWRRSHPGPLAQVLQDPEGWNLYVKKLQAAGSDVPLSYEEWIQSPQLRRREATLNWTTWRRNNIGPMAEVLRDPEGWQLYCEMKEATGGMPFQTFEEWHKSAEARKKAVREWHAWKKQHPGPRYAVLADPLGWQLYRIAFGGQKRIPETYDEYVHERKPTFAWLAWRKQHPGPLLSALADAEGWQLYKQHMEATGREVPQNFNEWADLHISAAANGKLKRGRKSTGHTPGAPIVAAE